MDLIPGARSVTSQGVCVLHKKFETEASTRLQAAKSDHNKAHPSHCSGRIHGLQSPSDSGRNSPAESPSR
jgi:hypothetical protein